MYQEPRSHWDSGPCLLLPPWAPPGSMHTVTLRRRARAVAAGLSSRWDVLGDAAPWGHRRRQQPPLHRGPEQRLAPPGANAGENRTCDSTDQSRSHGPSSSGHDSATAGPGASPSTPGQGTHTAKAARDWYIWSRTRGESRHCQALPGRGAAGQTRRHQGLFHCSSCFSLN